MTAMTAMTAMPRPGGGSLAALSGLYGDPVVTDALITSRARNTAEGGQSDYLPQRSGPYAPGQMPTVDAVEPMGWWQPEVRGFIAALELARDLVVEADPGLPGVRLWHRSSVPLSEQALAALKGVQDGIRHAEERHPLATIHQPGRGAVDAQLEKVVGHADSELRRARANEAVAQILPQVPFWSSVVPLSPWRTPATYEFVGAALNFGNQVCHRVKHALAVPRPAELSPAVQPILQTPGWAALPSGHATEAFLFARLMPGLLGQKPDETDLWLTLLRQACSIADNRVYAGLHFPMDGVAGRVLGHTLAEYVLALSGAPRTEVQPRCFGAQPKDVAELDLRWTDRVDDGPGCSLGGNRFAPKVNPILRELGLRSRRELAGLGFGTAPRS